MHGTQLGAFRPAVEVQTCRRCNGGIDVYSRKLTRLECRDYLGYCTSFILSESKAIAVRLLRRRPSAHTARY